MKILAFSDLHGSYTFLKKIKQAVLSIKPDLILIAGDFLNYGEDLVDYAQDVIDEILITNFPVFAVTGNSDTKQVVEILENAQINIENRSIEFKGETITGISPDPTKPISASFIMADSIVLSHIPIRVPLQKLPGAPKIWISAHLHFYKTFTSHNTLYIYLPLAYSQKMVLIDTDSKSSKLLTI